MNRLVAWRRVPPVVPPVVDALLAMVFVVVGQVDVWLGLADGDGGRIDADRPLSALLSLVGLSMLALRRRAPLPGLAVMLVTVIVQVRAIEPVALFFGQFIPILVMSYAVAAYSARRRDALLGLAVAVGGAEAVMASVPDLNTWDNLLFNGVLLITSWTLGYTVGAHRRRAEQQARRAERLEHDREQTIVNERARLARELHDIVAHSVSVIAVQAEAGEAVLDEPERAAEAFRSIQATSRQALVELRRLLGLLSEVDGPPALAPQPGLASVRELVEQMCAAGLDVDLAIEGPVVAVDAGLDLSAYRVIQEALTNTLKHAGSARAHVRIRYVSRAIEIEVVDEGRGAGVAGTAGHGLVGMRERVALYGGDMSAGVSPEGGFAVRARLPLASA